MSGLDLVQSLHENLTKNAGVRSVFGEPITTGDKIIIPVARVAYGFGAGGGFGHVPSAAAAGDGNRGEGGGGGGGAYVRPVGVYVISPRGNCFLAVHDHKRSLAFLLAGIGLGLLFRRCRR